MIILNNEATLVQNDINNKMQDIEYATSDCEQSSSKSLSTFMLNMVGRMFNWLSKIKYIIWYWNMNFIWINYDD